MKLVSDYFTCTWKSEEKNISVVRFILFDLLQPLSALSALSLRKVSIFLNYTDSSTNVRILPSERVLQSSVKHSEQPGFFDRKRSLE